MNVLVVDDEPNIRQSLRMVLESAGHRVVTAESAADALRAADENRCDVVLLDVWLPDGDGLDVLAKLKAADPDQRVIMISGHGTIETAMRAVHAGAYDFLEKPLDRDKTLLTIQRAGGESGLRRENRRLRADIDARYELVGDSPAMRDLRIQIAQVAPTRSRVLVTGESGAGKELVAYAIHHGSPRADGPFVRLNCAAIPPELIESELFGHEAGAFTGARGSRTGKFEQASGGTLLLDEVGDMSAAVQAKVLRALQEDEIERVGGHRTIAVDVRVVAATNKSLAAEVAAGRFREDLLFRLNVFPIHVPPLRSRVGDVSTLARHFVAVVCRMNGMRPKRFLPEAMARLERYAWPGNVRELRNAVERAAILAPGDEIGPAAVGFLESAAPAAPAGTADDRAGPGSLKETLERAERDALSAALGAHAWNVSAAARALGMDRTHLHKKMTQHGLRAERRAAGGSAEGA